MAYVIGVLAIVGLVEGYLLWRINRSIDALRRTEEKVAHFGSILSLLTETTESGFHALAQEIGRVAEAQAAARAPRLTNRRVADAARRGRTVQQIAAEERVAEGEVQLRHFLGTHPAPCPCAACSPRPAAMRAKEGTLGAMRS